MRRLPVHATRRAGRTLAAALVASLALAGLALAPLRLAAAEAKPLPKGLPQFGPDRPLPMPPILEEKTPEGLTIWIVARPGFPKVSAVLTSRGGMAADPADLPGLSQLLAQTIKEGTATRTSRQIAEQLQAIGGEIDASAGGDSMRVVVSGLASGTGQLLTILADVARHAAFDPAEVKLAQDQALGALQAAMAEPGFFGQKAFAKALYGDHPYHVTSATAESIRATTPAILHREMARRIRPERSLLVVIGDVDAKATAKQAVAAFAGWQVSGEAAPPTPAMPQPQKGGHVEPLIEIVDRPNSVQSQILVGSLAPRQTDPDYYALLVANSIFGGSFGSRLTTNIREDKGYTYSPFSGIAARQMSGRLQVRADVRNEVTGASINEILYELGRMTTTSPTADEMTTAKRFQNGTYLILSQRQASVASLLANNWTNDLPDPRALGDFVTQVNAVKVEDVDRVSKAEFPAHRQVIVVVGDSSRVKGELELFGPVTVVAP